MTTSTVLERSDAKMKRKYLDELDELSVFRWDEFGSDDSRQSIWCEQRKKYGFDSREFWNLDIAF